MTEPKRGRGRPSHQPTDADRNRVSLMAASGCGKNLIAKVIGISEPTLELHYAHELEVGLGQANFQVAANLFRQATKDDPKAVTAAMFWLKSRAGWSEHGPVPAALQEQEKQAKLGKKDMQDLMARNPDETTPIGALMAKRQQSRTH